MEEKLYLKVLQGNVLAINSAGNPKQTYYRGGNGTKAVRAYWNTVVGEDVEVYLENGKILILNKAGNIRRTI